MFKKLYDGIFAKIVDKFFISQNKNFVIDSTIFSQN